MKLSIITINYNNREGLQKTIESVVNQTWKEFEYIVIDGASTDGSVDVIKRYADKIDYWVSESDEGIYNAMNKGIDVANGEYCIFINSGDYLYRCDILSSVIDELDGTHIITGTLMINNEEQRLAPDMITLSYLYESSLSHPSSFIKTFLLKRNHYDEKLKIVSDWKFFVQVLLMGNATYKSISQVISNFDITGISTTNTELSKEERQTVLENDFPKRIYKYYQYNTNDYDAKLYHLIRESKYRNLFYSFNIFLIKFYCFINRKKWVHGFPLKLN